MEQLGCVFQNGYSNGNMLGFIHLLQQQPRQLQKHLSHV